MAEVKHKVVIHIWKIGCGLRKTKKQPIHYQIPGDDSIGIVPSLCRQNEPICRIKKILSACTELSVAADR